MTPVHTAASCSRHFVFSRTGAGLLFRFFVSHALVVAGSGLSACTPSDLMNELAWRTVDAAVSERGVDGALRDLSIQIELNGALLAEDAGLFTCTSTTVFDSRVLLTGVVLSSEARSRATVLARNIAGVRDVMNELQVGEPDMVDTVRDMVLAERFEITLALDSNIPQRNYRARIVGQDLYLFGIARDPGERERVMAYARACPRIRTVTDHTRLKAAEDTDEPGDAPVSAGIAQPSRTSPSVDPAFSTDRAPDHREPRPAESR